MGTQLTYNERSSADSLFRKGNAKLYIFHFEQCLVFILPEVQPEVLQLTADNPVSRSRQTRQELTDERTMFKSLFRSGSERAFARQLQRKTHGWNKLNSCPPTNKRHPGNYCSVRILKIIRFIVQSLVTL